eukprot:6116688-Pyramimonas_sp.AAC.1
MAWLGASRLRRCSHNPTDCERGPHRWWRRCRRGIMAKVEGWVEVVGPWIARFELGRSVDEPAV